MTALRPPLRGNIDRNSTPLVFYDQDFYTRTRELLEAAWMLGRSRYCVVGTFIGPLMMLRSGALEPDMQGPENAVKTVLASGSYGAQCIMVCHCARMLLQRLQEDRRQLIMERSVLQTGTTTSQQSSTTRHTVVLWPALLQKLTAFGCRPHKMVNALSRYIGVLSLIRPCDHFGTVPVDVRRFYELLDTYAFRPPAQTTNLTSLASEVIGASSVDDAGAWVVAAFDAWRELHAELRSRLEIHKLPPAMRLDDEEESRSKSVDDPAACSASVEVGPRVDSTVESPVVEAPRDSWNYMKYAVQTLLPGLEGDIGIVTVNCNREVNDFQTLQTPAQERFEVEVHKEFPVGKELLGIVLDLTVNYQNWNTTQYLYACLVGRETTLECQHPV